MLLHIVHPWTYLASTPTCFEQEAIDERNRRVGTFAEQFGEHLLVHYMNRDNPTLGSMVREISIKLGEGFEYLMNGEEIWTAQNGLPYPSTRPEKIDQEEWDYCLQFFSTEDDVLAATQGVRDHLFIGGVLENCVANAMTYCRHYVSPQGSVHYVPDLCVSANARGLEAATKKLSEYNIHPLTPEEALARLEESKLHEEGDCVSDKTQE